MVSRIRSAPTSVLNGGNNSNSNATTNVAHRGKTIMTSPRPLFLGVVACLVLLWIGLGVVTLEYLPSSASTSTSGLMLRGDGQQQPKPNAMELLQGQDCPPLASPSKRKPEFIYSLRNPMNDAPFQILHTVTTRFMIGQPHQPILARARYLLMETFCWPTVKYQTRQNFYWIVLVDPRLDNAVIQDIQTLLTSSLGGGDIHFPSQNAFLVLTDNPAWAADGVGVPNVTSYGVGLQELAREYQDGNVDILSGNTYHLMKALEVLEGPPDTRNKKKKNAAAVTDTASKPVLMIETLLDADDGLNNHGIEWIQDLAIEHATHQQEQLEAVVETPNLNSTWWVLCGTDHIEWHNRDIYKLSNNQYEKMGLTAGITGIRHAPLYCASAGYTRVGLTIPLKTESTTKQDESNINPSSAMLFPQEAYSNHALAVDFPFCNQTYMSGCLRREFNGKPYILKSRSITSDSMDHMNPKRSE